MGTQAAEKILSPVLSSTGMVIFFAVAGVTKKIKVTEISIVVAHAHFTVLQRLFSI